MQWGAKTEMSGAHTLHGQVPRVPPDIERLVV